MTGLIDKLVRYVLPKRADQVITTPMVLTNQLKIKQVAERESHIFLITNPLGHGHVEHYHHFIFDLVVPLYFLHETISPTVTFYFQHFGPLTGLLSALFGERVQIVDRQVDFSGVKLPLYGIGPRKLAKFPFENVVDFVLSRYAINSPRQQKVLLIERAAPTEFYENRAVIKSAGSARRSIKNHEDLVAFFSSRLIEDVKFQNLKLEELDFHEQLEHFRSASLVVAQHGAGLANILWMHPTAQVLELGFKHKDVFEHLAMAKNHRYQRINYDKEHIEVDISVMSQWIENQSTISSLFKL